ncbi:MAG: extracellular solute-binding protein [Anaerolineae bacterium]|nr:extracellular solute-binding protein [Anaerolineae bacterium]
MRTSKLWSRRSLLQTGALMTGATVLAACAGATPAAVTVPEATAVPEEKAPAAAAVSGTVRMWEFPMTEDDMAQIWNPLLEKFNAEYPDIEVNIEILPWGGRREKMLTAYAAGEAPDMAYVNIDTMSLFGTNGVLMPLDDMIPAEIWDDMSGDLIEGLTWEGERLMFPCFIYYYGRLYNKGLFEEVGLDVNTPPATWDDMRAYGAAAKTKDYFLTNLSTIAWDTEMITTLWQAGGRLFNEDFTKVQLDTDAAYDTWKFEADMFQNGWVPKEGAVGSEAEASGVAATDYWITGKQILSHASTALIATNTRNQAPEIDFGLCPTLKYKRQVVLSTGACWGVFKNRPALDPVAKWLLWLIGPEPQGFYCSVTNNVPGRLSAMPYWEVDETIREFSELHLPYGELNGDATHYWQEGKVICAPHRQASALGLVSVEEALAAAQAEFQAAIDEALA